MVNHKLLLTAASNNVPIRILTSPYYKAPNKGCFIIKGDNMKKLWNEMYATTVVMHATAYISLYGPNPTPFRW